MGMPKNPPLLKTTKVLTAETGQAPLSASLKLRSDIRK